MKEEEIKNLFKEIQEGPSYGFSMNTMRKINSIEQKRISFSKVRSGSVIALIVPAALLMLLILSLWTTSAYKFEVTQLMSLSVTNFNLDSEIFSGMGLSAVVAALLVCAGLWFWIFKSKEDLRNLS